MRHSQSIAHPSIQAKGYYVISKLANSNPLSNLAYGSQLTESEVHNIYVVVCVLSLASYRSASSVLRNEDILKKSGRNMADDVNALRVVEN